MHYTEIVKVDMILVHEDIMRCIKDDEWQAFRVSLKGTTTLVKLYRLQWWLENHREFVPAAHGGGNYTFKARVQVMNYINAIKRGGQLDRNGNVQR